MKSLFIFRRDLRIYDNTGLIYALEHSKEVIPCFIFTPEQIENNSYRSDRCLQFMIESLKELQQDLKLYLFFGHPATIVKQCHEELGIDAVIVNRDYTPYSRERDLQIESQCQRLGIAFKSFDDALLHAPEQTTKSNGKPYTIFTPFYKRASQLTVQLPACVGRHSFYRQSISFAKSDSILDAILPRPQVQAPGGRKAALRILKNLEEFKYYSTLRDYPAQEATTHLSAHLKFTTISIRELYHALLQVTNTDLIRSLYWRDFFSCIAFHFPYVFEGAFQRKYNHLPWNESTEDFERWCQGMTGFPIVDAGMREMNETGFMHNRVRMITASFLVKDLHINWQWGERYFAQKLIDYDPAVNNGNWQWAASTGCDAQPYFRIFNPWSQQKKFDAKGEYIAKWEANGYPTPMLDHAIEAKKTLQMYTQTT